MKKILCLNKISPIGTDLFGEGFEFSTDMKEPDGILVRSASMHGMELGENLLAISRAGAGVNNIPIDSCTEQGIAVFNTPGANANAVKELVIASLLLSSRKIIAASDWVKTLKGTGDISKQVESGKSNFTGPEIKGKTLGVIGLGAIGILVANAAKNLGMTVYGYDPFLSVSSAWHLSHSVNRAYTLDDIYSNSDYISLHLPLTDETREFINTDSISKMKQDARVLNFARGELVNSQAIIAALAAGKISTYATDFPDDELIGIENVIAIPHLGASTPESEDNCAVMAVDQMREYIQNGNISNSVNLPTLNLPREHGSRITVIHKNVPNTIGLLSTACGKASVNIENMLSKSKKGYAYTVLDVSGEVTEEAIKAINDIEDVIRVRLIK